MHNLMNIKEVFTNLNKVKKNTLNFKKAGVEKSYKNKSKFVKIVNGLSRMNIPGNYESLITLMPPATHLVWFVNNRDPAAPNNKNRARKNWFTPGELRNLVRHGKNKSEYQNAYEQRGEVPPYRHLARNNKNNYGIYTALSNTILFNNPTTRRPIKRKNIALVRRRANA